VVGGGVVGVGGGVVDVGSGIGVGEPVVGVGPGGADSTSTSSNAAVANEASSATWPLVNVASVPRSALPPLTLPVRFAPDACSRSVYQVFGVTVSGALARVVNVPPARLPSTTVLSTRNARK
jgi:hypothetical protein